MLDTDHQRLEVIVHECGYINRVEELSYLTLRRGREDVLVSIVDIVITNPPDPERLEGATMSRLERCVLVLQVVVEDRVAGFVSYHQ